MKYLLIVLAMFISSTCYSQINERPGKTHTHHGHDNDDDDDDDDGCLPITLINFKANVIHNAIKITWSTSSETDNDYFTLFRSPNGFEYWELVGSISGAGNCNIISNYSYIDTNPSNGVNYYVLMQTDYNGTRVQFDPIAVQFVQIPDYSIWDYYNFLGQEIK